MRTLTTAVLTGLLLLSGCASRTTGHVPSDIAIETSNVQKSTKTLIQAVSAAELTLTPEQKKNATLNTALDNFYKAAYQVGSRGEQIADALVAYDAATDAATKATLAARIQALLPLLQTDLQTLVGINLGPINTSEIVKLVKNVNETVAAIQKAVQGRVTAPSARYSLREPRELVYA